MRPRPLPYHTLFSHAHLRTPTSSALLTPCTLFALVLSCFNAGSSAATLAPRASTTTSCIRRPRSSGPPPKVAVSR